MAYGMYAAPAVLLCLLCAEYCNGVHLHHGESSIYERSIESDVTNHTSTFVPSVRPVVESTDRECLRFEHSYCNSQFRYSHGLFPNHKGQTAEQAAIEFGDFMQLIHSGCSDKLGTFLCFTYFPLCEPTVDEVQEILPCMETCEEVHKSECTEYVVNATNGNGWADHLKCDQDIFKPMNSMQCAIGESNSRNSSTEDGKSGDASCEDGECQSKCAVRGSCNRGTFKNSKNKYKFAAKVTVARRLQSSHICKHAYSVDIEEQYNLLSHNPNTNKLTEAPVLLNGSIIQTSSPLNCEECPILTIGSTYLIAGQYRNEDGTTVWELPNSKALSLASKWEGKTGDKYNERLREWIAQANDVRSRRQGI